MEFNSNITNAAERTVKLHGPSTEPLEISDYPGMFVAKSGCDKISAMNFFTAGGDRFVIGPLLKG